MIGLAGSSVVGRASGVDIARGLLGVPPLELGLEAIVRIARDRIGSHTWSFAGATLVAAVLVLAKVVATLTTVLAVEAVSLFALFGAYFCLFFISTILSHSFLSWSGNA